MGIEAGQDLLHFRLTEQLGEGGMGVVWRATDTTLDREVAIKILPDAFANDAKRLARFEREAKVVASLNHPNIAAVYGLHAIPRDPGSDSGQLRFIVMELVEGDDLAQRLALHTLPLDEALSIASQIAQALEAAHENGIVHRDLKPANVCLTADGKVKVLDFGLAKSMFRDKEGSDSSLSPTITHAATQEGAILGTPAYMSPEQARGKPVDKRTDVWAFGCVLHEMLTGKRTFDGGTISDVIAAVLTREPDDSLLPRKTPASVRLLLCRCLDKNANERLRDIGEARIALAGTAHEPALEAAPATGTGRERLFWLAAIIALLASVGWLALGRGPGQSGATDSSFTLTRLTELPGPERNPHLSPDGRLLLYDSEVSGNRDVFLLRVGGARAINLTEGSDADDSQASFGPDGDRIAFRSERDGGGLFVMGATGESVRRLTDFGFNPAWSRDGNRVAFATEAVHDPYSRRSISELWIANVANGTTQRLTETDAVQPSWSPADGRLVYWASVGGQRDIWTIGSDGGDPRPLTQDTHTDWSPIWSSDGRTVYFSSDRGGSMDLWRIAVDPTTGEPRGEPRRVTGGVRSLGHASLATDGSSMALMAYDRGADIDLHRLDPSTPVRILSTESLRNQNPTWCKPSSDGQWIACTTRGGSEDIVLLRVDGTDARRMTDNASKDRFPIWSPDGTRLVFNSTRSGDWEVWTIRSDGSDLRQLTELGQIGQVAWSGGGERVIATARYHSELWMIDPAGFVRRNDAAPLARPTDAARNFSPKHWSLTGDRIVGAEFDSIGRTVALGLLDLPTADYRALEFQHSFFLQPAGWLPDARRFILAVDDSIRVFDSVTGQIDELMTAPAMDQIAMSPDGRYLLVEQRALDSDIWLLRFDDAATR